MAAAAGYRRECRPGGSPRRPGRVPWPSRSRRKRPSPPSPAWRGRPPIGSSPSRTTARIPSPHRSLESRSPPARHPPRPRPPHARGSGRAPTPPSAGPMPPGPAGPRALSVRAGRGAHDRDADDGAVSEHQGRASGRAPVLPDGRLLRTVLRRRGRRLRRPRHRPHHPRRARGRAHPHVRRSRPLLRGLPPRPHPPGPPRRHLRADGGPGRGEEARLQVRRAARGGPPRHPGHPDRGRPAGRAQQQLPRGLGRDPGRGGARLGRHLDRRVPRHVRPPRPPRARAGAPRPAGGHRPRGPGGRAAPHDRGGGRHPHPPLPGQLRQRPGGPPDRRPLRRRHAGGVRRLRAGRARRHGRRRRLARHHPEGGIAPADALPSASAGTTSSRSTPPPAATSRSRAPYPAAARAP